MAAKKRKRPAHHTVRVSAECHKCICVISRGLDRPKSWVVEHAVAEYAVIRDLEQSAQLRRPRLEVRA